MPVPKLEEFKAPWEMKDGAPVPDDEQVVDKDALKKYLHGLLTDKERLQASIATITQERDTLKGEIESKKREGESEEARLKRENEELKAKVEQAGQTSIETLKLRAALKVGLSAEHVDRLIGTTAEELEADAEKFKASLAPAKQADDDDDDEDDDDTPRRRPRSLHNPADPKPDKNGEMSVDKMLDLVPRNSLF